MNNTGREIGRSTTILYQQRAGQVVKDTKSRCFFFVLLREGEGKVGEHERLGVGGYIGHSM